MFFSFCCRCWGWLVVKGEGEGCPIPYFLSLSLRALLFEGVRRRRRERKTQRQAARIGSDKGQGKGWYGLRRREDGCVFGKAGYIKDQSVWVLSLGFSYLIRLHECCLHDFCTDLALSGDRIADLCRLRRVSEFSVTYMNCKQRTSSPLKGDITHFKNPPSHHLALSSGAPA